MEKSVETSQKANTKHDTANIHSRCPRKITVYFNDLGKIGRFKKFNLSETYSQETTLY
jgi:hypothetical protein